VSKDIAKLPQWAQNRIRKLESDNADLQALLNEGPEDSNTFADPYSDLHRKPLGRDTDVAFYVNEREYFKVGLTKDGELDVYTTASPGAFSIKPRASNAIVLTLESR
jgi:hypothetical protein